MNVYFISGLAADHRVFGNINLPQDLEVHHLQWIPNYPNETLEAYAARIGAGIDTSRPFSLVGLSMGGMIAVEIAKLHKPVKLVIISSVSSYKEFPSIFRFFGALKLYSIVPVGMLKKISIYKRKLVKDNDKNREILKQVIRDSDPGFVKWGMQAILEWKNLTIPEGLIHIHGNLDEILPYRFTKPSHMIKGGRHLMIMEKSAEINNILSSELFKKYNNQHL